MAGIVPGKILQRTTKGLAGDIELTGFKEGRPLFEKLFLDGECRLAEMGLVTPSLTMKFFIPNTEAKPGHPKEPMAFALLKFPDKGVV